MTEELLRIENLTTSFRTDRGVIRAVDRLNLAIRKGEVLGLVGESGCGKSVTSLSIMGLVPSPPGQIESGRLIFKDRDLTQLSNDAMRQVRGNEIAMIFQEPMTSLNPVFTIGDQIMEAIRVHERISGRQARERAERMLGAVSIPDPGKRLQEYPHQLSGGMRQRAMIAMALACRPELLIADEPTTALDVTIQAQIMSLLLSLRDEFGLAILLITHDLGVVAEVADRVAVMYAGRLVEVADSLELFSEPLHPYTRGLLRSVPRIDADTETAGDEKRRLDTIEGMVPSLSDLPPGCAFAPRCPHAADICRESSRMTLRTPSPAHSVRCTLYPEDGS